MKVTVTAPDAMAEITARVMAPAKGAQQIHIAQVRSFVPAISVVCSAPQIEMYVPLDSTAVVTGASTMMAPVAALPSAQRHACGPVMASVMMVVRSQDGMSAFWAQTAQIAEPDMLSKNERTVTVLSRRLALPDNVR